MTEIKYTRNQLIISFEDGFQTWLCKSEGGGPYIELIESDTGGVYFEDVIQIDEYCEQLKKLLKEGDFLR